jgi:hypothetical protein
MHVKDVRQKRELITIRAHNKHLLQNQQVLLFLDQYCLLCIQKCNAPKIL